MTLQDRFRGCILAGAIGDAMGSAHENLSPPDPALFQLGPRPESPPASWQFTDDTQLTLGTCEAIIGSDKLSVEKVGESYLRLYQARKLTGLGASTLKALRELAQGMHWSQAGRRGEYAAGNGAAMRIAPLAFLEDLSSDTFRDICYLTHHNDEAYIGAKAVLLVLQSIIAGHWKGEGNLFAPLILQLPDTRLRDRLIAIEAKGKDATISAIGAMGSDGYVVHSVPLALFAATKVKEIGLEKMYEALIEVKGDTDTNCSIAGQLAGALIGVQNIPKTLLTQLQEVSAYEWLSNTLDQTQQKLFRS